MNITKKQLEDDLHALKSALKMSGYNPDRIIRQYQRRFGKWSERKIKKRKRVEKLRPGAQKTLDHIASFDEKAVGNLRTLQRGK